MWPPLFRQASVPSSTAKPSDFPVAPQPSSVLPSNSSTQPSFFSLAESSLSAALAGRMTAPAIPTASPIANIQLRRISPPHQSPLTTKVYPRSTGGRHVSISACSHDFVDLDCNNLPSKVSFCRIANVTTSP